MTDAFVEAALHAVCSQCVSAVLTVRLMSSEFALSSMLP